MGKKLTQDEFIKRCDIKHNYFYDYSLVIYKELYEKIIIICPVHGEFEQTASNHLYGSGCYDCGVEKNRIKKILTAKNKFIDFFENDLTTDYEYDWDSYVNATTPMRIKCSIHGWWDTTTPHSHKSGTICPTCALLNQGKKRRLSIDEVKRRIYKIDNKLCEYDWSTYTEISVPMRIVCSIHGEFWQNPDNHWRGHGCYECGLLKISEFKSKDINIIKLRFFETHGELYIYDWSTYKNATTNMTIICSIHGKFDQTPHNHASGQKCPKCMGKFLTVLDTIREFIDKHGDIYFYDESTYVNQTTKMDMYCLEHGLFKLQPYLHRLGIGCPRCVSESVGESTIYKYLYSKNINFERQKRFDDCRNKKPLPFDFFIEPLNILIEFDGIQHFEFCDFFHKTHHDFEEQQLKDKIKTEYCENKNIKLIRIPYWKQYNIENILDKELNGFR